MRQKPFGVAWKPGAVAKHALNVVWKAFVGSEKAASASLKTGEIGAAGADMGPVRGAVCSAPLEEGKFSGPEGRH